MIIVILKKERRGKIATALLNFIPYNDIMRSRSRVPNSSWGGIG
jgi:hypothetical protein